MVDDLSGDAVQRGDLLGGEQVETPGAAPASDIVTGTPVQVRDRLRRYLELGFGGLSFIPAGADRAEQFRRIAGEILPGLRDTVSAP